MSGIENFSGFEVIRAAMEVEKQGRQFYSAMSTRAHSEMAREIFSLLAQDEIAHLTTLENMVPKYQDGAFWENEELFLPYLRRFSSERVFPSPERIEEVLRSKQADLQSLALAIEAEEKFAEYFRLAAAQCLTADGKEAFAWLAAEEERHAKILKDRREKLSGKP
ncbi:ferritin-like domain-containing protein [Trichloromonas sp.]|uniref:ferritin-like domain-containing protein n=1 Tax=Trichloromonas sp. TaxID=3069249 RepID=UPI003D814E35